jgi:hypothetical protein
MAAVPGTLLARAPGVYEIPETAERRLTGVRMDVCAFVGVAPRGPAREPARDVPEMAGLSCVDPARPRRRSVAVPVESFDAYVRLYGGFEGPGRLPYAVASFFEQGGRRAYVVRIVHRFGDVRDRQGVAHAPLAPLAVVGGGVPELHARNEGTWGARLTATLTFTTRPLAVEGPLPGALALPTGVPLAAGALLRLRLPGGTAVLRSATAVRDEPRPSAAGRRRVALLDAPLPAAPEAAEVVEGRLDADDGDGRTERHDALGLAPEHPRWLADVLCDESALMLPDPAWADRPLLPGGPELPAARTAPFDGGDDRSAQITPDDFFDPLWTPAEGAPGDGVYAIAELDDVALLVVPDLYSPGELPPLERILDPVTFAGPDFARCVTPPPPSAQAPAPAPLAGLTLDPRLPVDRDRIVAAQLRLQELVQALQGPVALLDVPPGLNRREMMAWRERFWSAFVAAYHPWLDVAPLGDRRTQPVRINPSAAAAGIIARRERLGLAFGPANELAEQVVGVAARVAPPEHDALHPAGINVFLRERAGVRLSAARTLSRDATLRQLSVRRLLTMLRRTLDEQSQWIAFAPHTVELRTGLRHLLEEFLGGLFRAGSFLGASEEEAFFVRCDDVLNSRASIDAGRLVAEVGVAIAEPVEFVLLRIVREGDGTLTVEAAGG